MSRLKSTQEVYRGGEFMYKATESQLIFTPEDFTDEHQMIGKTAKQFLEKEVLPNKESIEQQDFTLVKSIFKKAGELGLLAHSIPENYGGLELDKISKGIVGESLGAGGSYSVAHANHTCIATLPITYFGTPWQKEYYLPKLASGEFIGAYCLTEPSAGSDALSAKTTAKLNEAGTHYLLNGTKMFITNAAFSDTFIVYAKVDEKDFTAFIVEKDFPGLSLGAEEEKMGIRGSSTTQVFFDDCEVPVSNLLGEVGKGHHIALNVLNLGRFNLGSVCMGAAKHALTLAIDYTKERQQFRQALASFTATQEKIANMATRIYAAESLQYRTASYLEDALGELYDSDDDPLVTKRMMEHAIECAICKVYGSETFDQVVDESLQLHGGYGFIKDYQIEQMYRDSRINRIFEGTNEINRLLIPTSFLRTAEKNGLKLEVLVDQAKEALQTPFSTSNDVLAKEKEAVSTIRQVLLLSLTSASQKFGKGLVGEQETLLKIAELAIILYSAESVVLRTLKSIEREGEKKAAYKMKLTTAFVGDELLQVEMLARTLFSELLNEEERKALNARLTEKCVSLGGGNGTKIKRDIARFIYEVGQYNH